jgi:hypothetical protein
LQFLTAGAIHSLYLLFATGNGKVVELLRGYPKHGGEGIGADPAKIGSVFVDSTQSLLVIIVNTPPPFPHQGQIKV